MRRIAPLIMSATLLFGCGAGATAMPTDTPIAAPPTVDTSTQQPSVTEQAAGTPHTTAPMITSWHLEIDTVPCDVSARPGSPGGEAVLPARWTTAGAHMVQFTVDGDLRPANRNREPHGPGTIQVPCDPSLNDGHHVSVTALAGEASDPETGETGETFIVITIATTPTEEG